MTTPQVVLLVSAVVAALIWQRAPGMRGVLRLLPVAALGLIVAPLFTPVSLPHALLAPALLGAGLAVAVLSLTR